MAVAGSTAVVNFTRCFSAHLVLFGVMKHQGASDSLQFIHTFLSQKAQSLIACICLIIFDLSLLFVGLAYRIQLYFFAKNTNRCKRLNLSDDMFETLPCA